LLPNKIRNRVLLEWFHLLSLSGNVSLARDMENVDKIYRRLLSLKKRHEKQDLMDLNICHNRSPAK
jgi:hypothetical protein